MSLNLLRKFIHLEAASGIILLAATVLALLLANSPWQSIYHSVLQSDISVSLEGYSIRSSLHTLINDGFMAIFFLVVSLEIKRELIIGELNSKHKAILPIIAAAGGMILPGLIYAVFNYQNTAAIAGWGIPTATDIAFSLGILMLLGKGIPTALKAFLTALAIIDDLGAILIIALFYTTNIALLPLIIAVLLIGLLTILNYFKKTPLFLYLLVGFFLWVAILKSGIHATVAGVILGAFIPLKNTETDTSAYLYKLENKLHPWVAYGILPLFALANAGLSIQDLHGADFLNSVMLGITLGLFLGKQFGIFLFSWLAIKCGLASLPDHVNWKQFYGVSLLCGIGFTMSLFIGTLAFNDDSFVSLVRLGVITGSLLSGIFGFFILKTSNTKIY